MKKILALSCLLLTLVTTRSAEASTFSLTSLDVSLRDKDPGLVLSLSNAWTGSFSLNSADPTETIKLFTIGTKETALNLDDLVPYDIKVGLGFSSPSTFHGSVTGATGALWLGQSFGYVLWNDPVQLAFGPGNSGLLQVALSNVAFGLPGTANVYATFTLLKEAQYSTPEPGTLALLGIGAVVAAMRRRARR
jgi:hypothetical protein